MFNTILNNIKNSQEAYSYLVDSFSQPGGLAYDLVVDQYPDPIFIDFQDLAVIQASEIIKGFRVIIKLEANYQVDNMEKLFIFALDCVSNKSFNSIKIENIVMK